MGHTCNTFVIINVRKFKVLKGLLHSNAEEVMLFILEAQYYVPVNLWKTVGSIHLFKITGKLTPEYVKLRTTIFGVSLN